MSKRKKLEQISATSGNRSPALDPDPIPDLALQSWAYWADLNASRFQNGMGITPLSWMDFDAWSRIRGRKPTFTELELIRVIDRAFVSTQGQQEQ